MPPTSPIFCDSPSALADALRTRFGPPLAVVGIGNALRGDDAFGPAVVAALEPCPALRLFDVQAVPESFLVPIVSSGCAGVLFVDAADLGAEPGRVALVPSEALAEVDVSTHAISLSLVAEAIQGLARGDSGRQISCALLGAQPADLKSADRLTAPMVSAVRLVAEAVRMFAACPGEVGDGSGLGPA
jgi:hydrogenase maturation protease